MLDVQALNQELRAREARAKAVSARALLGDLRGYEYERGVCDFQEAEAAVSCRDYPGAEVLIRRALKTFASLGSRDRIEKCWAVVGTIRSNSGRHRAALPYFNRAINALDPDLDAMALSATLNNRANALAQLGQFAGANAEYARALKQALHHGFSSSVRIVRTGLAEIEFLEGRYGSAVRMFRRVAADYIAAGSVGEALFAGLYVAESLGRLGRLDEMADEVEAIRESQRVSRFHPSPALEELFSCLDQGTIDADLVSHVREYLQDIERGVKRSYRTLRRA
jgi:tetratricopeptide (TPR) repeat protein